MIILCIIIDQKIFIAQHDENVQIICFQMKIIYLGHKRYFSKRRNEITNVAATFLYRRLRYIPYYQQHATLLWMLCVFILNYLTDDAEQILFYSSAIIQAKIIQL